MIRRKLRGVREQIEDLLRRACGELTPDKRIIITVSMLLFFTTLALYMSISSIYRFGKGEGERLHIKQIQLLQLELQQSRHETDSLKQSKEFYDERE